MIRLCVPALILGCILLSTHYTMIKSLSSSQLTIKHDRSSQDPLPSITFPIALPQSQNGSEVCSLLHATAVLE